MTDETDETDKTIGTGRNGGKGSTGSSDEAWFDDLYSEANQERSPAEVDARILQAAASRSRRRWPMLATAAVLVVAAGIVFNVPDSMLTPPSQSELATTATPTRDSADAMAEQRVQDSEPASTGSAAGETRAPAIERAISGKSASDDQELRDAEAYASQFQQNLRMSAPTPAPEPATANTVEDAAGAPPRDREAIDRARASTQIADSAPASASFEQPKLEATQPAGGNAVADSAAADTPDAAESAAVTEVFAPRLEKAAELEAQLEVDSSASETAQPPAPSEDSAIDEIIVTAQKRSLASFSGRGCPTVELYIDSDATLSLELRQCSNGRWTLDPERKYCKRYLNVSPSELLIEGNNLRWAGGEDIRCERGRFNQPEASAAE
ncbi:MAG: hypothetical protein NXH85_11080 [Pseudomonadaceae bacterium]|nr:hypothetical protein [Pseudomonadaceae bacterium]